MSQPLAGQLALVTGASRGIGAAIAQRLAHDGADVILHYGKGQAEAEVVAQSIRQLGRQAWLVQADLAQTDGYKTLSQQINQQINPKHIHILVNNAGITPYAPFADTDEATFDLVANVNMRSPYFITQQLLPLIPDGGRIIMLSSLVARAYFEGIPAYAGTKGFIDVITLHLAAELAPRRITVNAVAPGAIDTRLSAWLHEPGGDAQREAMQALPGVGQPHHVAGVVAFLAGPDGEWTTGQVIDASGGSRL